MQLPRLPWNEPLMAPPAVSKVNSISGDRMSGTAAYFSFLRKQRPVPWWFGSDEPKRESISRPESGRQSERKAETMNHIRLLVPHCRCSASRSANRSPRHPASIRQLDGRLLTLKIVNPLMMSSDERERFARCGSTDLVGGPAALCIQLVQFLAVVRG